MKSDSNKIMSCYDKLTSQSIVCDPQQTGACKVVKNIFKIVLG